MYKCNSQPCMLLLPIVSFFELVCHKHWCKCSSLLLLACGLSLLWQVPEGAAGTVIKVPHPKAKGCLAAFRGQDGTKEWMPKVGPCCMLFWEFFAQKVIGQPSCSVWPWVLAARVLKSSSLHVLLRFTRLRWKARCHEYWVTFRAFLYQVEFLWIVSDCAADCLLWFMSGSKILDVCLQQLQPRECLKLWDISTIVYYTSWIL